MARTITRPIHPCLPPLTSTQGTAGGGGGGGGVCMWRGGRGGVHGEGEISCSVIFGVGERGHYQWRRTLQFYLRCRHDTGSLETMESTFQGGNWSRPQLVPVGAYKWLLLELGIVSDLLACTGTGRGGCTASGNKCHPRVILSSDQ